MANPQTPQNIVDQIPALHADGLTDREMSARLGISSSSVSKWRRHMGIKPNDFRYTPSAQQVAELHERSNREMARLYGTSPHTWARLREKLGIDRFRNPTTVNGEPAPWIEKPRPTAREFSPQPTIVSLAPRGDTSLAGEAATFLRKMRFPNVFNRAKVYGAAHKGWQVGRSVLTEGELIDKASRLGFQRQAWMGG